MRKIQELVLIVALACLSGITVAQAAIKTKAVEYKQGDTVLEGFLAWDDAQQGKRPGVLVVHEWDGLGDYAKMRAEMLAKLGFIAFAPDIYGKGVRPATPQQAAQESSKYGKDRPLMRQRVQASNSSRITRTLTPAGSRRSATASEEPWRSSSDAAGLTSPAS